MIVKRPDGWYVVSKYKRKDGKRKNLGGPYATRKQAEERLREIEYFKKKE